MIDSASEKFALNDDYLPLLIFDNYRVKFFVVWAIGNIVLSLDSCSQVTTSQIPSEKPLPFIRKILRVICITLEIRPYSFKQFSQLDYLRKTCTNSRPRTKHRRLRRTIAIPPTQDWPPAFSRYNEDKAIPEKNSILRAGHGPRLRRIHSETCSRLSNRSSTPTSKSR
jgi:hypothetical protein